MDARAHIRVTAVLIAAVERTGRLSPASAAHGALANAAGRLRQVFRPTMVEPFALSGDELQGRLDDPAQMPLCVSILRELIAPFELCAGVGIGADEAEKDTYRDPHLLARAALETARREGGLLRYRGTGTAGDLLLNAICRLVDPLVSQRTDKQWEAIAAYRRLGHQGAVAAELGVTRQSVGDRLKAGHRRRVEEADAAVAAYLNYVRRP